MTDPALLTVVEAAELVAARELAPLELVEASLARIERLDPELRAFVTVAADDARRDAVRLGEEVAAGRIRGPLHGIPLGVKDVIDTAGMPTTSGSRVHADHVPANDAVVVSRLRAAGAIVMGKTNPHELALGPISPPTRNAWDPSRIPGGSSGGSAVAVAAGMCMAALGTDTGGSIRIPAAFNGIVGLKPTYGRVPLTGIVPVSWSLDHAGPMTRSVADAALALSVMAGRDPGDPASAREPVPDYAAGLRSGAAGLRLGLPRRFFHEVIETEVSELVDEAARQLGELGAQVVEVEVADVELSLPTVLAVMLPELSSRHQRGLRRAGELYGLDVRAFLELGELYLGTHYLDAQRARGVVKEGLRRCFEENALDALLTPATPMLAPPAGQATVMYPDGGEQPVLETVVRTCAPFNLSGQPAVTVPCGFGEGGLPVGLAIAGRPFAEATVLRVAAAYERATGWHERRPPLDVAEGAP